jgi:transcriptional regulator with XRE-family HTH domain
MIMEDTIRLIKKLRLSKDISHDALANKVGISRPAISHIENGKRRPTLLMVLKLAHGLDTDLSSIVSEAEKLNPRD